MSDFEISQLRQAVEAQTKAIQEQTKMFERIAIATECAFCSMPAIEDGPDSYPARMIRLIVEKRLSLREAVFKIQETL